MELGDARHVWWSCPLVRPFWYEVIAALTAMLGYPIPADPSLLLVGVRHPTLEAQSRQDRKLLWGCLGAAKTAIAFYWRKPQTPLISLWWARLWSLLAMEKLAVNVQAGRTQFEDTWSPLIDYLNTGLPSRLQPPRIRSLGLFS
mgnify:CR=1 FL=1